MRRFFRVSGGGNDFLALIEPQPEPTADDIQAWCRRGLSAGADGVFLLRQSREGVEMRYYNADGQPAALCLNATRCAVQLARHLGWGSRELSIETGAGTLRGRKVSEAAVALDLPEPVTPETRLVEIEGSSYSGWFVTVGVPHFVLPWGGSLADAPVVALGAPLRGHPMWGQAGANVDFVRFVARHRLEIRTFERGVEAETLACGTGVMASVAAGLEAGELELPVSAQTLGGFELEVSLSRLDDANGWSLTGDARIIAEGSLHPGAREIPTPPRWT